MRIQLAVAVIAGIASAASARPASQAQPVALDAQPETDAAMLECARTGKVAADPDTTCKTLASATIAGRAVRVVASSDGMDDFAHVELAGDTGPVLFQDTLMHYTKLMGERGEDVQTDSDWSATPTITVTGHTATITIPWRSRTYDRASGRILSAWQNHAVAMTCAVGPAPACSEPIRR